LDRIKKVRFDRVDVYEMLARGLYNTTKEGYPVLIERVGLTQTKALLAKYSE
jgi:hypothetical protein